MKLLIVDDQKSVHLYLQKALDLPSLGYTTVFHAENGMQAFDIIDQEHPEVMLLDIQMPVMDGLSLLETLKNQKIKKPETIILTAFDEFTYAKRCIDFGVCRYILKPIDPDELSSLLLELSQDLNQRQMTDCQCYFSLCCAQPSEILDEQSSLLARIEPFAFGIVCLPCKDVKRPLGEYCSCISHGLDYRLIRSHDVWKSLKGQYAAGCSTWHAHPKEMLLAVKEASYALWQSFYIASIQPFNKNFFVSPPNDEAYSFFEPIVTYFSSEDRDHLSERVKHTFLQLATHHCPPQLVFFACRKLLSSLYSTYCPNQSIDFNNWANSEGFISASTLQSMLLQELLTLSQLMTPSSPQSETEAIARIHDYVADHYAEDLSLNAMASRFFISRYQISRLFKQIYNVNYQDHVLSVRMKAAAYLLRHTHTKLYEISLAVGFDEPSYFSNVFKKYYGLSPRAFRMQKGDL